jgi:hypothetical protein
MQAAAEIHQPTGTLDQRSQNVGRKGVHRESAGMTFGVEPRLRSV